VLLVQVWFIIEIGLRLLGTVPLSKSEYVNL